jgi:hypothetical protein
LGVLSINAFTPIENEDNAILEKVRNLLINELKDTDALVIDMRDNGGGLISMADTLPQLFGGAKPVVPNAARAVVSSVNNNLFAAMERADPWYNATQRAPVGSLYKPIKLVLPMSSQSVSLTTELVTLLVTYLLPTFKITILHISLVKIFILVLVVLM